MDDSLKDLHEQTFAEGQKAVAKKYIAQLFEEEAELAKRAGEVASEVVDLATEIAADGNPHKEQIARILQDGLVKALKAMQRVGDGDLSVEERRRAVEKARPFSVDSKPSETPSLNGPPPLSETSSQSEEDRPKRGRPPGAKNRPKPDQSS